MKFRARHVVAPLPARFLGRVSALDRCRRLLRTAGVVGQDSARYEGAGFGNLSVCVARPGAPAGRRQFLVSGTQTGALLQLGAAHVAWVRSTEPRRNRVRSVGLTGPSSEAMTHGAVYDALPWVRAVVHGHAPGLWRAGRALGLPCTDPALAYGTPAMAAAVAGLLRGARAPQVLVMGGHEDGVLAVGATLEEATGALLAGLARVA